jgi:hypothetical protein
MWTRRVMWLVVIYAASVVVLGAAAMLLRRIMSLVGLTG